MTPSHRTRRRIPLVAAAGLSGLTATAVAVAGLPAAVAAPTTGGAVAPSTRAGPGRVVAAQQVYALSSTEVAASLRAAGFDAGASRFGVQAWRLVYRTVDVRGRPTTASGLVALPDNENRRLQVVSFMHGSEVYRGDAPSVSSDPWATAPPFTYASAGFAAVAPDYLGLGVGPGRHPWLHVPSEVSASLDLLHAAREFAAPRQLDPDVLITGFSQGASAATGLAQRLNRGADPWFRAAAVAGISGAYDVRNAQLPAMLGGSTDARWSTAYTAYLLVAWNRIHHLYDSPDEVFRAPYAATVPALFDGEHEGSEVAAGLPGDPATLLTPRGTELLKNPSPALSRALRQADSTCLRWSWPIPVRLYVSPADEQAAPANTRQCADALLARRIPARVVDVGPVDHLTTNRRGTADAVRWFLALSQASEHPA
jgi:hypothetical protein